MFLSKYLTAGRFLSRKNVHDIWPKDKEPQEELTGSRGKIIMNVEWERIRKGKVVTYFAFSWRDWGNTRAGSPNSPCTDCCAGETRLEGLLVAKRLKMTPNYAVKIICIYIWNCSCYDVSRLKDWSSAMFLKWTLATHLPRTTCARQRRQWVHKNRCSGGRVQCISFIAPPTVQTWMRVNMCLKMTCLLGCCAV